MIKSTELMAAFKPNEITISLFAVRSNVIGSISKNQSYLIGK